jgi:acetoin utilization protein AcuB
MITALELINNSILPLETSDKAFLALKQMEELRLAHLPVINNRKLVGIVNENDLLEVHDDSLPVENFLNTLSKFSIKPNDHFYNALKVLAENKISMVPVCEENDFYLGAVTSDDLVQECANVLAVKNPGGIIILQVNEADFSLAEIARIIETNDTKILSCGIHSVPETSLLQVTLKLNKINIEPVLQTFSRFEYDILFYFGENEKDEELLRQRYDSLMMYLKM